MPQGPLPDRLTFVRPGGGRFQIGSTALGVVRGYAQDRPSKPEAGGVLLGRHLLGTCDIVVDRVTTPQPEDRQSHFWFFRARRRHQELIDQAWWESDSTCTYLGEWHTHPELVPTPSVVDALDWRRKLLVDRFSGCLFFVIVGTEAVRVWEGRQWRARLWALERTD